MPAPDGTFIHPRAAEPTKLSSSHNRPAPGAVTSAPLLAKDAAIDLQGKGGQTALIIASQVGHEAVVEALLAKGANINHQNEKGVTALLIASNQGHERIVQALLNKGADVDLRENGGGTAIEHAKTEQIKQLLRAAGAAQ